MRTLVFVGEYAYNKINSFTGLVALCHFEPFDDIELVEKFVSVLIKKAGNKKIILVPFAHLHNKVAPIKEAEELFKILFNKVKLRHADTEFAPFAIEKELHISVAKDDSLINFLNFKPTYLHEVRRLYEVYAGDYDEHMMKTNHYGAQEHIYEAVKSYIKDPVLDLACGPGFLLSKIVKTLQKFTPMIFPTPC